MSTEPTPAAPPPMHHAIQLEREEPPDRTGWERLEAEWLEKYGTTTPFAVYHRPEPT